MNIWLFSPGCNEFGSSTSKIAFDIRKQLQDLGHTIKWVGLGGPFDCKIIDLEILNYIKDVDKKTNSHWSECSTNLFISREETSLFFNFWIENFQETITFKKRLQLIYNQIEPHMKIGDFVILNDMILSHNIYFVIAIFNLIKKYNCKVINYVHTDFLPHLDVMSNLVQKENKHFERKQCENFINNIFKDLLSGYEFTWITTSNYLGEQYKKLEERLGISHKYIEIIPLGVDISKLLKIDQKHIDLMFQKDFLDADCIIYDYDSSSEYNQEFVDCFKEISKILKSIIILKHDDCKIDGIRTINLAKELNWSTNWVDYSIIHDFILLSDFHLNTTSLEGFGLIPLEFSLLDKYSFLPNSGAFPYFSNRSKTKIYQNLKDIIPDLILAAKNGKKYRTHLYESSNNRFLKQISEFIIKTFKEN